MENTFDEKTVLSTFTSGSPLEFKYSFISEADNEFLLRILSTLLAANHFELLSDEIDYIFNELVTNANKANLKRAFFNHQSLNIFDSVCYHEGMKSFITCVQKEYAYYSQQLEKLSLYTRVIFQLIDNQFVIKVINSRCPTIQEISRINNIIEKSKKVRNTIDAFTLVSDKIEGASLGTITSILMLRRLGLDNSVYHFIPDEANRETMVSISIPLETIISKQATIVSDDIAHEIDTLPVFPENINRLIKMVSNETVDFGKIAEIIQSDPALTADILKIVNSAQYMLPTKVSNISNAISLIGIKSLKSLLFTCGARNIFDSKYGRLDDIWEHAFLCASYSYKIAKDFQLNSMCDDVYIGGMLHDMGKIIIQSLHPKPLETIKEFCKSKGISEDLLEKLALGVSHDITGAEISKKWNFPDTLTAMIRFHHKPLLAPEQDKVMVYIIYLANILTRIRESDFQYHQIEKDVLDYFMIQSKNDILELEKKLHNYFQLQKMKVQSEV